MTAASVFVLLVLVVLVRVEVSFGGAVVLVLGGVVDLLAIPQNSSGLELCDRHCVSVNSSSSIAFVATTQPLAPIGCLRALALRHVRSVGSGVPSVHGRHLLQLLSSPWWTIRSNSAILLLSSLGCQTHVRRHPEVGQVLRNLLHGGYAAPSLPAAAR